MNNSNQSNENPFNQNNSDQQSNQQQNSQQENPFNQSNQSGFQGNQPPHSGDQEIQILNHGYLVVVDA